MKTLDEMLVEENEIRGRLNTLNAAIRSERIRIAEATWGVTTGSIVKYRGKEYFVTAVKPSTFGNGTRKPWLDGNPRRKDGTFGSANRCLFDFWEKVPGEAAP